MGKIAVACGVWRPHVVVCGVWRVVATRCGVCAKGEPVSAPWWSECLWWQCGGRGGEKEEEEKEEDTERVSECAP